MTAKIKCHFAFQSKANLCHSSLLPVTIRLYRYFNITQNMHVSKAAELAAEGVSAQEQDE